MVSSVSAVGKQKYGGSQEEKCIIYLIAVEIASSFLGGRNLGPLSQWHIECSSQMCLVSSRSYMYRTYVFRHYGLHNNVPRQTSAVPGLL